MIKKPYHKSTVALRLPSDWFEELKEDALKNQRAISRHINYIVYEYVRKLIKSKATDE